LQVFEFQKKSSRLAWSGNFVRDFNRRRVNSNAVQAGTSLLDVFKGDDGDAPGELRAMSLELRANQVKDVSKRPQDSKDVVHGLEARTHS